MISRRSTTKKDENDNYFPTIDTYLHSDKDYFEKKITSSSTNKTGFFVTTDTTMLPNKVYYIKDPTDIGTAYRLFTGTEFNTINKQYYTRLSTGTYKRVTDDQMDSRQIYYEASYTPYTARFSIYQGNISTVEYLFTKTPSNTFERCYDTTRRYIGQVYQ